MKFLFWLGGGWEETLRNISLNRLKRVRIFSIHMTGATKSYLQEFYDRKKHYVV